MYNITNFTPFRTNFVGFDNIFDDFERMLVDPIKEVSKFPVYDLYTEDVKVLKGDYEDKGAFEMEKHYIFKFALAGVDRDRLSVFFDPATHILEVKCDEPKEDETSTRKYIHKGIAQRSFVVKHTMNPDLELVKCSTAEEDGPGCLVIEFRKKTQPEVVSTQVEIQH